MEEGQRLLDQNAYDADYRRRAALRALNLFSDQLGGIVDGLVRAELGQLVPNLTSVALLLTVPFPEVVTAVKQYPALEPNAPYGPRLVPVPRARYGGELMGTTIREYCEKYRPDDDLESLYFVLQVQFSVAPDDDLTLEVLTLLQSLDAPAGG